MKNLFKILPLIGLSFLSFTSCNKDKKTEEPATQTPTPTPSVPTPTGTTGSLKIEFNNQVDGQALVLDTSIINPKYTNPNAEPYNVSKLKYYISNIVLIKNDDSQLNIKNYFHIVNQADASSRTIKLDGVNNGNYKAIKFTLGIDSVRNRTGVQSGALDPAVAQEMYWSWTQGYVFLILEGSSSASSQSNKGIIYHMGGFGGPNKTQRSYEISFNGAGANVSSASTPVISLKANVNEMFKSPNSISFAVMPAVASAGVNAKKIADNYSDMFSFGGITN